jgi:hypothetical protein
MAVCDWWFPTGRLRRRDRETHRQFVDSLLELAKISRNPAQLARRVVGEFPRPRKNLADPHGDVRIVSMRCALGEQEARAFHRLLLL